MLDYQLSFQVGPIQRIVPCFGIGLERLRVFKRNRTWIETRASLKNLLSVRTLLNCRDVHRQLAELSFCAHWRANVEFDEFQRGLNRTAGRQIHVVVI